MEIIEMEELICINGGRNLDVGSSGSSGSVTGGHSYIDPHRESGVFIMAIQGGGGGTSFSCN